MDGKGIYKVAYDLITVGSIVTTAWYTVYPPHPEGVAVATPISQAISNLPPLWIMILGAVGILMLLSKWIPALLKWLKRPPPQPVIPTPIVQPFGMLKQIRSAVYTNETVPLDGCDYVECKFTNVTFQWEGSAGTRMTNCEIHLGPDGIRIATHNNVVQQTIEIFRAFLAHTPVKISTQVRVEI
jgi:hypothetical protein